MSAAQHPAEVSLAEIVEGFRSVTTPSVADAVDRVVHRPGFMSPEIKPVVAGKVVGPAITVLEGPALECPVSEGCVHFMGLAPDHDLSSP
jgi:regulator of RNase E activity RraA